MSCIGHNVGLELVTGSLTVLRSLISIVVKGRTIRILFFSNMIGCNLFIYEQKKAILISQTEITKRMRIELIHSISLKLCNSEHILIILLFYFTHGLQSAIRCNCDPFTSNGFYQNRI